MERFTIPGREEVSTSNQTIFDQLEKGLGFVPNLYAYYAKNDTALGDYLTLQNRKSTLRGKEKEIVNLVVSEFNQCHYCISAHTVLGKQNGFTDEEVVEIRKGTAGFDSKLNSLAKLTRSAVENKGKATEELKEEFFAQGYSEANLIDVAVLIGDKTISNFIHNLADFPIDFPKAQKLETAQV